MVNETNIPAPTSYTSPHVIERISARFRAMRARTGFRVTGYFLTHPAVPRWIFARLRRVRPIFMLGSFAIVTRHDDVKAVLNRNQDFELGLFARDRMLAGNFILNTDWPRSHREQEGLLRTALFPDSGRGIMDIAKEACDQELETAGPELDMAAFARNVSLQIIQEYYGVTIEPDKRSDLAGWLTELASAIILLPPHGMPERAAADNAAIELRGHVLRLIKDTPTSPTPQNTLSRLVQEARKTDAPDWLTDDWVARMVCGLVVFGMATVVRTASDTIDELLKRPDALQHAMTIAKTDDRNAMKRIIYEALRFRPMLPVLARYCPRATIIGTPGVRRRVVSAGTTIWAPPLAGMHDPLEFEDPNRFSSERDVEKSLVFGSGLHKCIGRAIAEDALIEIVSAVLRRPNVRRLTGGRGKIVYKGAAADQLWIGI